jgi:hypothetical protein
VKYVSLQPDWWWQSVVAHPNFDGSDPSS